MRWRVAKKVNRLWWQGRHRKGTQIRAIERAVEETRFSPEEEAIIEQCMRAGECLCGRPIGQCVPTDDAGGHGDPPSVPWQSVSFDVRLEVPTNVTFTEPTVTIRKLMRR